MSNVMAADECTSIRGAGGMEDPGAPAAQPERPSAMRREDEVARVLGLSWTSAVGSGTLRNRGSSRTTLGRRTPVAGVRDWLDTPS